MNQKLNIFISDDYKYISNFIESKIQELKNIQNFNNIYIKNAKLENELETSLNEKQKMIFEEYLKLIYELEEFYFAFAYSLGVKYEKDLENL